MRDEIDLTPTLGRLDLLAPADQLALDPKDLSKGPDPAKAPVHLDDVSGLLDNFSIQVTVLGCAAAVYAHKSLACWHCGCSVTSAHVHCL